MFTYFSYNLNTGIRECIKAIKEINMMFTANVILACKIMKILICKLKV